MEADTFVVFKSVMDSANCLDETLRNELCYVVLQYGFTGVLVDCNPIVKAVMISIMPNIDSSKNRYKASANNGKLGGRPKTKNKPNNNLDVTKDKPSANLYKDKDKDKDKDEGYTPLHFKNYMNVLEFLGDRGKQNLLIEVKFEDIIVKVSEYGKAYDASTLKDLERRQETRFLTYLMNNIKEIK